MQKDLPEDAFVQYSVENVDHNTCTKDGNRTFHGMRIISLDRQVYFVAWYKENKKKIITK